MKRCPSCDRTYSDETISFCLADGALLSPSYDRSKEQGPTTEILPPQTRPLPPTQASATVIPTIASFPVADHFAASGGSGTRPARKSRSLFWIASAIIGVAIVAGLVFALRQSLGSRNESVKDSNSQERLTGVNDSQSASASPNFSAVTHPTEIVPSTRSTPRENKGADPLEAKPATSRQVATPTASPSVDYSRIFSGRDVDQQVRVLSKPDPVYTAEARRNQITGTVVLRAVFSFRGEVTNIHAVSGLSDGLTERAISAAKQIKFVPAMKDGHPVSMWMELQYHFNLY